MGLSSTEDGMCYLSVNHDIASLQAADYRITLLAKHLRKRPGETRTLAQLRADLTVDLLLGRLTTAATTGELEQPETSPSGDPLDQMTAQGVGRWARPVINVTVPFQTLAGLTDDPGTLAGGEVLPAARCRRLAQDPDSTWYRLLTDPATGTVELSTTACGVHHQAKHAPGFGLSRTPDGTTRFHTGAGFTHPAQEPLRPTATGSGALAELARLHPTAAELTDALAAVALHRRDTERTTAIAYDRAQLHADYQASYPEATDEDIWAWMSEENPAEEPPPLLRRGVTRIEAGLRAARGVDRYDQLRQSAPVG